MKTITMTGNLPLATIHTTQQLVVMESMLEQADLLGQVGLGTITTTPHPVVMGSMLVLGDLLGQVSLGLRIIHQSNSAPSRNCVNDGANRFTFGYIC